MENKYYLTFSVATNQSIHYDDWLIDLFLNNNMIELAASVNFRNTYSKELNSNIVYDQFIDNIGKHVDYILLGYFEFHKPIITIKDLRYNYLSPDKFIIEYIVDTNDKSMHSYKSNMENYLNIDDCKELLIKVKRSNKLDQIL